MAEAYTLSQEQSDVLGRVISSIVKEDGAKSFSSEELGIIKHIISPDDYEIMRRYMNPRMTSELDDYDVPSLGFSYKAMMGAIGNIFQHSLFGGKSCQRESWMEAKWKTIFQRALGDKSVSEEEDLRESEEKIDGDTRQTIHELYSEFSEEEDLRESEEKINGDTRETIHELYWEMMSRCACGVDDAYEVSLALFDGDTLRNYSSWLARVVLIVAAFAMSFGEFWLTVEPLASDPLSESICLFRRPDCLLEVTDSVKFGLESLRVLVERIWDLTNFLVDFARPITRFQHSCPEAYFAGNQVVYSAVICLSHNIALVRMNKGYTTLATEVQQMRSSSERLAYLHSYLNTKREAYFEYSRIPIPFAGGGYSHKDIADFLRSTLFTTKKLIFGHHSKKVKLSKFKCDYVALLISDFKVQKEEFSSLIKTYKALQNVPEKSFDVIWVPMMLDQSLTWTADDMSTVHITGASMPWYWVLDPSIYRIEFVQQFVKEQWKFQGKPILVIFDWMGEVLHTNALPMLELWGPSASPFALQDEPDFKKGLSHAINYMFSKREPNMEIWAAEGKIMCFYGSHNEDWIRTFLHKIECITVQTSFEMEITYVGTNKIKQEELPRILSFIKNISNKSRTWCEEGILSLWQDLKKITSPKTKTNAHFSTRKELVNIFSYDEYEDGWALLFGNFREDEEVVKASGTKLIECLGRFPTWGSGIQGRKDFLTEFNKDLRLLMHAPQHCCKGMKTPTTVDGPVWEHCMECGRFMIN